MKNEEKHSRKTLEPLEVKAQNSFDLQAVQKIGFQVLSAVAGVLNRHEIPWFLAYGSCLGAVRHGGFIPWDDDVDIGMLRGDYSRARTVLMEELPQGYTFCDRFTEKDYPYNFAKVRRDGTVYTSAGDMHLNIHHGIGIDIFPFDACPSEPKAFRKIYRASKRYRLESDLAHMNYRKGNELRSTWQLPIILLAHMLLDPKRVQEKLDHCISAEPYGGGTTGTVCSWLGDYVDRAQVLRSWLVPTVMMPFEGALMPVPQNYDKYLTALYGDYMTPPPESERKPRHTPQTVLLTEYTD